MLLVAVLSCTALVIPDQAVRKEAAECAARLRVPAAMIFATSRQSLS